MDLIACMSIVLSSFMPMAAQFVLLAGLPSQVKNQLLDQKLSVVDLFMKAGSNIPHFVSSFCTPGLPIAPQFLIVNSSHS